MFSELDRDPRSFDLINLDILAFRYFYSNIKYRFLFCRVEIRSESWAVFGTCASGNCHGQSFRQRAPAKTSMESKSGLAINGSGVHPNRVQVRIRPLKILKQDLRLASPSECQRPVVIE